MSRKRKTLIGLAAVVAVGVLAPNGWYILAAVVGVAVFVAYLAFLWLEDTRRDRGRR
ncbi:MULTISPECIES: hypothetical protein [unclassified Streptomyces]|uniref:hypothetical protein n=1 Tax=unclassified Streptomyces TaxID=2593676 RepID=UPI0035DD1360